jgi:hypothetical protein
MFLVVRRPERPSKFLCPYVLFWIVSSNYKLSCNSYNYRRTTPSLFHYFNDLFTHQPIYPWLYSPCGPWPLFHFLNPYIVGRTPWTRDQPVARPLPTHTTAQTQNKRTQTFMPRAGLQPTIPARTVEDGSCFRPRDRYFDWLPEFRTTKVG